MSNLAQKKVKNNARANPSDVNLLALVNFVSLACHKSRSFDDAIRDVLGLIAKNLKWPVGHAFYIDESRTPGDMTLVSSRIWYQSEPVIHNEFRRVTEAFTASAKGMPLAPQWREDVYAIQGFSRARDATSPLNVAAAFNLPVVCHGKLVAVVEFFHTECAPRDDALLEVASMLGHHLAQAYETSAHLENSRTEVELTRARALADRVHALRELATGVSHEINNPLTIAMGHLHLARSSVSSSPNAPAKLESHFEIMESALKRVAGIVQSMRQFCQVIDTGGQIPVNASDTLHKALSFCAGHIENNAKGVSIRTSGNPSIEISANSDQMCIALAELIKNAVDAVSDQSDKRVDLTLSVVNDRVQFIVTDSGRGIPSGISNRVMEPFFTTKEVGKGSGLGLSSAKGIIESHRGSLTFESRPGCTTFVIDLPHQPALALSHSSQ